MENNPEKLDFPFSFMKENFKCSKIDEPVDFVSEHWNVFGENFEQILNFSENWERMLRNAITLGLNDSLTRISNKRFLSGEYDYWLNLRNEPLIDLMDDPNLNDDEAVKLKSFFHETATLTSYDFVIKNTMKKAGMPLGIDVAFSDQQENKVAFCNQHDLDDIYHSWKILTSLNDNFDQEPLICEIGSGYGGLISKIKSNTRMLTFNR